MTEKKVDDNDTQTPNTLAWVGKIVSAYLQHNQIAVGDIPDLIRVVGQALRDVAQTPAAKELTPAISIGRSIRYEYIVCLEDGRKLKTMKRYLAAHYALSPEQYRKKWNLPADYPMVAPCYSEYRSVIAKKTELGRGGPSKKRVRQV